MTTTGTMRAAEAPAVHHVPLSIRILRRLRPLIAWFLGSPLHGVLSGDVLLLSWSGRKSGKRYALPISYTELGGRLYLCTRAGGSTWWRHLRNAPEVGLVLKGKNARAIATVLDPASAEALDGLRAFLTRNPGTGRLLYNVAADANGTPREDDVEREVLASIVVRLEPLER